MIKFLFTISALFLQFQQPHSSEVTRVENHPENTLQFYAYKEQQSEDKYHANCMPCTPSQDDPGTIAFTHHWKIVYVPNQAYLGRIVMISQRHFGTYEEMTDEEAAEYREIFKTLLPALQKTFKVTHFNVAYLMNMAYNASKPEPAFKDGQPDPHFHWHVIPRYDGTRQFGEEVFEDPDFGNSFNFQRKKVLVGDFRKRSIEAIRRHLNIIYLSKNNSPFGSFER